MTKFENRPLAGDSEFELAGIGAGHSPLDPGPVPYPVSRYRTSASSNGVSAAGEPRFHALGEQEFDVVAVIGADGRFIFVSASAERVFGYDVSDAIGLDAFGLFDSASIEPVRALFNDLVAGRRLSVSLEMRTVRADGRADRAGRGGGQPSGRPDRWNRGQHPRYHRPQEPRADRSATRDQSQTTLIESLADGVMLVDADRHRRPGQRGVRGDVRGAPGAGRSVATSTTCWPRRGPTASRSSMPRANRPTTGDHSVFLTLERGRRSVGVIHGVRRKGQPPLWIRSTTQALRGGDGTITGAIASFSDVTALRKSAAELHREERFLQVLLDTLEEGIVACDAEGRITVFNPAARICMVWPRGTEPIGRIPSDHGLRRPDGSPMAQRENPLIRAMSGEQLRDVEIVLESGTGDRRKVSVNGQALVDDDGQMLGAVVAMHDVTEQKLNEERLAELALHDPLTGLANRTLLAERLQEAIDEIAGHLDR